MGKVSESELGIMVVGAQTVERAGRCSTVDEESKMEQNGKRWTLYTGREAKEENGKLEETGKFY